MRKSQLLRELRHDLPASIVVFFVAVPLCLGIALASGAPLFSGLIAGIIGGIVVGSISGSALGVSGPAAGLAVIVLEAITTLGFPTFLMAVAFAGAIQIALGASRAGVIAYFFPSSVIKGMLAGIGLIIIMKQIPHALGHDTAPEGNIAYEQPDGETTLSALAATLGDIEPSALVVCIGALLLLLMWETARVRGSKIGQILPGPLAAVAFGVSFQALSTRFAPALALEPAHLVNVPVAAGWADLGNMLTFPEWSRFDDPVVHVTAVSLAVVASLETLLCVEATDKLDPQRRVTPANRELVAQGCGNMLSGLVGGLPITQVIVRSSANALSGGRTSLSAILHGVLLLVAVIALPNLLNMVPLAVLASILFVVGYKLARPSIFKSLYDLGPAQFAPFIVTVVGIIFTDLLVGIALGMVVALFILLTRSYSNSHFLHLTEHESSDERHIASIQLAEEVTFLNKGAIIRSLDTIPNDTHVRIDSSQSFYVDYDVLEAISEFEKSASNRGITIERVERTVPASAWSTNGAQPRSANDSTLDRQVARRGEVSGGAERHAEPE